MKPRFKMVLTIDTMAHAITIRNSIIAQLSGKDIFEQHTLGAELKDDGTVEAVAEWRFNNSVDRNTIKDWLQDQVQNSPQVKTWVSNAKLSWHNCTHDDLTVQNCKNNGYFEWTK